MESASYGKNRLAHFMMKDLLFHVVYTKVGDWKISNPPLLLIGF